MEKDFNKWNERKIAINDTKNVPFFHEKEIWFCFLGANVGFEQDGRGEDFQRPIIVIKKFNNEIFWAVPLTKTDKKHNKKSIKYYYNFSFVSKITSVAILSQIRLVDAKRLSRHIGTMTDSDFEKLTKKLKALLP